VIVATITSSLASRLMASLSRADGEFETIVVDNGTGSAELGQAAENLPGARVLRMESNLGYSRAVNAAAREAEGDALVLLNDDAVVEPRYVGELVAALDPGGGVVMATGVMLDAASPGVIDTAGMEMDRTLLAFDYLNGEPVERLDGPVPDPIGPSGATAAFSREAFLEMGGFDEALFAYLEDVDLVLRLRTAGATCKLAKRARGLHWHSGTLGSGSSLKDYLMGYGRGYVLRKWGVLGPRRVPAVLARELTWVLGQAIVDGNLGGLRGRVRGYRAGRPSEPYPPGALLPNPPSLPTSLRRRWRRRARIRRSSD
jgi:N-acetylglucosaminyl-diphospho-decaprenol L-rhamnosyltransferase